MERLHSFPHPDEFQNRCCVHFFVLEFHYCAPSKWADFNLLPSIPSPWFSKKNCVCMIPLFLNFKLLWFSSAFFSSQMGGFNLYPQFCDFLRKIVGGGMDGRNPAILYCYRHPPLAKGCHRLDPITGMRAIHHRLDPITETKRPSPFFFVKYKFIEHARIL